MKRMELCCKYCITILKKTFFRHTFCNVTVKYIRGNSTIVFKGSVCV